MTKFTNFLGIDVSKSWLDVAYYWQGDTRYLGRFQNHEEGYQNMILQLLAQTGVTAREWFVVFENTGSYSKELFKWLYLHNIVCREENSLHISRSMGLRRGKDDKVDASAICLYAFRFRDSLQPNQPEDPDILKLKKLLSRRDLLTSQKVAIQVSLQEQLNTLDDQVKALFEKQTQDMLTLLKEQIQELDTQIKEVIKSNQQLALNNQLVQSVVGIGPITAAFLLAFTNNFQDFANARKFACYAGVAPFPHRSGSSIKGKTRVNHLANKRIKALLSNGVQSAIVHDNELKLYFKRKMAEGKAYGSVINAVKNKIIQRAFAVINRQTPYVPIMNYV